MTCFGRAEAPFGETSLVAEVRSVNARHLDVRVRTPRELAAHEAEIRRHVARAFSRGSVEVQVRVGPAPGGAVRGASGRVEIDFENALAYAKAAKRLAALADLLPGVSAASILSLPGVTRMVEAQFDSEQVVQAIEAAVSNACAAASSMRSREGEALDLELRERLRHLSEVLGRIEARADELRRGLRDRLEKRLAALAGEVQVDPGRLEQEVVLYADRMDVTEEQVRFRSHLEQIRGTLDAAGPVGRKLEFLVQELVREANTIGSKAADASIGHEVVELKTHIEKLREQVMNVE